MLLPGCRGVLSLSILLIAVGCSKKAPQLVQASGKVQSGGAPVPSANVTFIPDAAKNPNGRAASGQTTSDGSFRLQTSPHGDGAMPGFYRVTVTVYSSKMPFPSKYTQLNSTPLLEEIPVSGITDMILDLK
jgi:hypothetical protein